MTNDEMCNKRNVEEVFQNIERRGRFEADKMCNKRIMEEVFQNIETTRQILTSVVAIKARWITIMDSTCI